VLVDRVRDIIAPKKTNSDDWLDVMRHAHRLGMSTTATMMYGHVETLADRVEHMRRIRDLQDETRGFRSFTSWTFQDDGNRLGEKVPPETMPTSFDYLLTQAVSRIYLDNVDHIQSSWVTQGLKIGQLALLFGANDMGSLMIEENVVAEAGTVHYLTLDQIRLAIGELGFMPRQRNVRYQLFDLAHEERAIAANRQRQSLPGSTPLDQHLRIAGAAALCSAQHTAVEPHRTAFSGPPVGSGSRIHRHARRPSPRDARQSSVPARLRGESRDN
jgi:cyclic dehypoxanthinyl futalosine synthase